MHNKLFELLNCYSFIEIILGYCSHIQIVQLLSIIQRFYTESTINTSVFVTKWTKSNFMEYKYMYHYLFSNVEISHTSRGTWTLFLDILNLTWREIKWNGPVRYSEIFMRHKFAMCSCFPSDKSFGLCTKYICFFHQLFVEASYSNYLNIT